MLFYFLAGTLSFGGEDTIDYDYRENHYTITVIVRTTVVVVVLVVGTVITLSRLLGINRVWVPIICL